MLHPLRTTLAQPPAALPTATHTPPPPQTGIKFNMVDGVVAEKTDLLYPIVKEVVPGSAANKAGIKVKDMIIKIAGKKVVGEITTADGIKAALATAGESIPITVGRVDGWAMANITAGEFDPEQKSLGKTPFSPMLAKVGGSLPQKQARVSSLCARSALCRHVHFRSRSPPPPSLDCARGQPPAHDALPALHRRLMPRARGQRCQPGRHSLHHRWYDFSDRLRRSVLHALRR